ncbi:MAG: hypothetical protein OEZ36_08700 [Spirochaetota bacterium]|nr:hypothetical protein [Spirochaetota bacterium]
MKKTMANSVIIVSEAVKVSGIPKSSITKFCRENRILSRLADGKIWLIDKDSLLSFQKKDYHPRMKRRKPVKSNKPKAKTSG